MAGKEDVKAAAKAAEKAVEKAVEKTVEKTVEMKEAAKAVANSAEVKEAAKAVAKTAKETAKATKDTAKKTVAKVAAKATEVKAATIIQYQNREVDTAKVEERVKAQFISEGHKASSIKTMNIYIKPEDYSAYYVINDTFSGRVDLF